MKKYLLPKDGNFYKANLHCHTTLSDGRETPEAVKEIYKEKGYSIVAFTEHEILVPHNDLTDDKFLALNGVEMQIKEDKPKNAKCTHMCFISPTADVPPQPCFHREKYFIGRGKENKHLAVIDEREPDYERNYTPEGINDAVKRFKEKGFFATYNHPTWSLENYNDYVNYEGFDAMEILNGSCIVSGYDDYNPRVYRDMLLAGKKLFCIGADDNHNKHPKRSPLSDSGCAYIMLKAEKLDYETIFSALKSGSFYASEGPEIYELYMDKNDVHISCSEAKKIYCNYGIRKAEIVLAEQGSHISVASFTVPEDCVFFNITVVDEEGKHACTNAYFVEDLMK